MTVQPSSDQRFTSLSDTAALWKRDRWVRPFIGRHKRALASSLGLGVLATIFAIGLMFVAGYLISDAAEQPMLGLFSLLVPLGLVQVFGIGKPFLSYLERLTSHDWVFRITSQLRLKLFSTIERNGVLWTSSHRVGDALGLLAEDIDHVQNLYIRSVFPLAIAWILWLLTALAFGFFTPPFGLFMFVGLGTLMVLVPLASVRRNAARKERAQNAAHELYARTFDNVTGIADWTFAQRKDDFIDSISAEAQRADEAKAAISASLRWSDLAANIVFSILCVVVLVWAALQFASIPQDAAAMGAAGRPADWLAAFVLGFFPLLEVISPLPEATTHALNHLDAIDRLNALDHDEPPGLAPEHCGNTCHPNAPYDIALENVRFSYGENEDDALKSVSLTIEAGQHVALLGPSGSGKTTLLLMLRGDISPHEGGSVTIGGVPVSELGDDIFAYVNLIQQSSYLFNQTLFENLALGDSTIAREDALAALERVRLGDMLEQLPHGLDTVVDEAGLRFSGGQRQRIALARILLRHAPIVLLDEPTAGLDPLTERVLLDEMFALLHDRTVIMVTHHLMGIEHMDRVLFMNEGEIALDGSPADLAETNERFRLLLAFDRGVGARLS